MEHEGRRIEVEVECAERTVSAESRRRLQLQDWKGNWRHLGACGFWALIVAEVLLVKDEKRQAQTVAVPWAEKVSRFARSFEAVEVEVLRAARCLSAACVSCFVSFSGSGPSHHRRAATRGVEGRSLEEPDAAGIDESLLSGQSYLSVLSDPKVLGC